MKIERFGIRLERVTVDVLELLRNWRNQDFVRLKMIDQNFISIAEQVRWFEKISNEDAFYFVMYDRDIPVGMIHLNKIDRIKSQAEAGLYIGNSAYLGTGVTVRASFLLLEFGFKQLHLNWIFAKTKQTNQEAIAYNEFLGFQLDHFLDDEVGYWKMGKHEFVRLEKRLGRIL